MYTVQWASYLGGFQDEAVFGQLAFISKSRRGDTSPPQLNELVLTGPTGSIAAEVQDITGGAESPETYTLFTALVRIPRLSAGHYHITGIEYTDDAHVRRAALVGTWVIDIRQRQPESPLVAGRTTIGGTEVSPVEAVLRNQSASDVTITGIAIDDEHWTSEPTLGLVDGGSADGASDDPLAGASDTPQQAPTATTVPAVTISAGEEQAVLFDLGSPELSAEPFVALRVLYSYETNGTSHLAGLPLQVYSPPFGDDSNIETYLRHLPEGALARPVEAG